MKNHPTSTAKRKRLPFIGIVLCTIAVTVLGVFAVSGTLAKFTSVSTAQSGAMAAVRFNFNEVYDAETKRFSPIIWSLDNLGSTINPNYSDKTFYSGAYGDFSFDVSFIANVPTLADTTVEYINETGAFQENIYAQDSDVSLRDLISLRFITLVKDTGVTPTAEEIDFSSNGTTTNLSNFDEELELALESTIGNNGRYDTLNTQIEKTVYVYWQWEFEIDSETNEMDTLFANYVSMFNDQSIDSKFGVSVVMRLTQDTIE